MTDFPNAVEKGALRRSLAEHLLRRLMGTGDTLPSSPSYCFAIADRFYAIAEERAEKAKMDERESRRV